MAVLSEQQIKEIREELEHLGPLPAKSTVGMPEDALFRPVAIAFACWEIRDLLDTIHALGKM